ncbi:HD domain-containing protein [Candidatus Chlorohelix sp.]|uniref:HD domain-containing protein n=1 Tax=Candidatus Chlorohelix sp. TaxID=3139201 RepID=UPI00302992AF
MDSKGEIILSLVAESVSIIRDTVWGDIQLDRKVLQILDTAHYQRLRGVQQLGFTSWTWPGAHHTRFEHSLGVFHLTRQAVLHLLRRTEYQFTQAEVNTALAAALLHDIGHFPFSHAVEELDLNIIRSHEAIGREIVMGAEIGAILRNSWGVEPEKVAAFITGDKELPLAPNEMVLSNLISGPLDADKLDYLTRDSRYCNVPYGMVDVQRLLDSMRIYPETPISGQPAQLVIDEKGVGALQSLIFARYLMFYNVYWHHTTRIATVMFLRALQEALLENAFSAAELERSNDASIITLIQNNTQPGSIAHELITDLNLRRFYKRAIALSEENPFYNQLATLKFAPNRRKRLEEMWCAKISELTGRKLRGYEILLDIPEPKGFDISLGVLCEQPPRDWHNPVPWGEVSGLNSDDMRKFHRHVRRVLVIVKDNELAEIFRQYADVLLEQFINDGIEIFPA